MIARVRSWRFCPSGVPQIVRWRHYAVSVGGLVARQTVTQLQATVWLARLRRSTELAKGKNKDCCERGKCFWMICCSLPGFFRYTFVLTVRVCYFGNVSVSRLSQESSIDLAAEEGPIPSCWLTPSCMISHYSLPIIFTIAILFLQFCRTCSG